MKTIVLYDNNGKIYMTQSGEDVTAENGANIVETKIPAGFYPSSVNPDTKEVVFTEIPKTKEQQKIEELETRINTILGIKESE